MSNEFRLEATLQASLNRNVDGAEVSPQGHLLLHLSDGAVLDLGSVVGPPGPPGQDGAMSPELQTRIQNALQRTGDYMTGELYMSGHNLLMDRNSGFMMQNGNLSIFVDQGNLEITGAGGVDMCNGQLHRVGNPTDALDGVNKRYVDNQVGSIDAALAALAEEYGGVLT